MSDEYLMACALFTSRGVITHSMMADQLSLVYTHELVLKSQGRWEHYGINYCNKVIPGKHDMLAMLK